MRTKKEIKDKIKELYELSSKRKIDILWVVIVTDVLCWVLGEDYLNTNVLIGDETNE